jgi:tetratricopeptide (TPR) repeat protein
LCIYRAVSSLEPKDEFLLQSVSGWLMLGNAVEASHEFAQLSPEAQDHPKALMALWDIHSSSQQWANAIKAADRLIKRAPDEPEGYIKRAYALHELKRTQEAWDTLAPVSKLFDDHWLIPYNLACYACQLGHLAEAVALYERAMRLGDKGEIRGMALNDTDLQPIRAEIEKLSLK